MNLLTCPACGMPHSEPECPACATLERIKTKARARRRDYAQTKASERSAVSHADMSQPKDSTP